MAIVASTRCADEVPPPSARLAVDCLIEQVLRELAAMAAALRGIDMLVFTGGTGENAAEMRERIALGAAWLGLTIDPQANCRGPGPIHAPQGAVAIEVVRTNEESIIARHTARIAATC